MLLAQKNIEHGHGYVRNAFRIHDGPNDQCSQARFL